MKKKFLRAFTLSLCLLAAPFVSGNVTHNHVPTVFAEFDIFHDPNGFCDIHWDETLSTIQSTHTTQLLGYYTGSVHYGIFIPEAKGCLYFSGPVAIRGIFMDDKLFGIQIPFSIEDYQNRYNALCRILGTPDDSNDNGFYCWKGPATFVMLTKSQNKGVLVLAKNPTASNS